MDIQLRHQPSFAAARILLEPNEPVRLESDAMMAMASDVVLDAKMEGGFMKSMMRAVASGESFFQTTATAGPGGGWIDVVPDLPGDLINVDVGPQGWVITRSSWVASGIGVELDSRWGGFKNLAGGEGGFVVHAVGEGPLLVNCYGALDYYDLEPGQTMTLDTGHMVMMSDTITFTLAKAADGWLKTAKTGENLVFHITGPGRVFTQTRNPNFFNFAPVAHSHGGG